MRKVLCRASLSCILALAIICVPLTVPLIPLVQAEGSVGQDQVQQDDSGTVVLPPDNQLPSTGADLSTLAQTVPPDRMPPTGEKLQTVPPDRMPPTGENLQTMPPDQMPPTGANLQTMPPDQMPPTGADLQTMPPDQMPPTGAEFFPMAFSIGTRAVVHATSAAPLAAVHNPDYLIIPAIDLETSVVPVGWETAIDSSGRAYKNWEVASHAAGWHNTSQPAGADGNIVISGHNNVRGSVFRDLYKLREGSPIILWQDGMERSYRVEKVLKLLEEDQPAAVRQENAQWIGETDREQLTLVTCWPEWSNTHRIVVVAYPVE